MENENEQNLGTVKKEKYSWNFGQSNWINLITYLRNEYWTNFMKIAPLESQGNFSISNDTWQATLPHCLGKYVEMRFPTSIGFSSNIFRFVFLPGLRILKKNIQFPGSGWIFINKSWPFFPSPRLISHLWDYTEGREKNYLRSSEFSWKFPAHRERYEKSD